MTNTDIYQDIAARTGGSLFVGVLGPVRTGKSTFIKRFMETCVIPNIDNVYRRERAIDELPQSGSGRTIMTAEPKFVPEEAVEVTLEGGATFSVRLMRLQSPTFFQGWTGVFTARALFIRPSHSFSRPFSCISFSRISFSSIRCSTSESAYSICSSPSGLTSQFDVCFFFLPPVSSIPRYSSSRPSRSRHQTGL